MNRLGTGAQALLGGCLVLAAVLAWRMTGSVPEAMIWGAFSVPFFIGAGRNLVRWNKRTGNMTKKQ